MTKMSRRITKIIGELWLPEITIKRRRSKNGFTTPYEIYGSQEVIKTLSDYIELFPTTGYSAYSNFYFVKNLYITYDDYSLLLRVVLW